MYMYHGTHVEIRRQLVELDFSLSHVGSRDCTHVVRLGSTCLYTQLPSDIFNENWDMLDRLWLIHF